MKGAVVATFVHAKGAVSIIAAFVHAKGAVRMRMCGPASLARHGHPRFSYRRAFVHAKGAVVAEPSFMRRVQFLL